MLIQSCVCVCVFYGYEVATFVITLNVIIPDYLYLR